MRNLILLTVAFFMLASTADLAFSAVDFTLEDMNGKIFILKEHIGKGPILLDFWATWCTPCKNSLPHLQTMMKKYEKQGLTVITISIDSPKSQSKIKPYVLAKKFTFPVLLDPNSEVLKQFKGNSVPFQVIIGKDGNVVETHTGYNPGDEKVLEEKIVKLLSAGSGNE